MKNQEKKNSKNLQNQQQEKKLICYDDWKDEYCTQKLTGKMDNNNFVPSKTEFRIMLIGEDTLMKTKIIFEANDNKQVELMSYNIKISINTELGMAYLTLRDNGNLRFKNTMVSFLRTADAVIVCANHMDIDPVFTYIDYFYSFGKPMFVAIASEDNTFNISKDVIKSFSYKCGNIAFLLSLNNNDSIKFMFENIAEFLMKNSNLDSNLNSNKSSKSNNDSNNKQKPNKEKCLIY